MLESSLDGTALDCVREADSGLTQDLRPSIASITIILGTSVRLSFSIL